ncbi:xanthine dehydrogenase family protein subunit M [Burkholderia sp. FERM BP-3421]|jgi:carbon-monoxide dehydrogenase medium subunit|uniref:FAD binding domain-containing protein n=1 Tax=Burkholderia sp. FERM BP-3421 TaxID=1494466 RepID=UPI00235E8419|nr:xanthine dehydrogenase family protein subunit M [Burkholderia sp. FERM BP-3421]WDD91654.1 xanthine dehydrogenase family protein subunit M [Burkholderia sp. FERM BP-3421]
MKPAPFTLHQPSSLDEALTLIAMLPDCRALAGGQSLMPMLNMRLATPAHIVDLNGIAALRGIHERDGVIRIGAMTTQRALEYSALLGERLPLLREAVLRVGHRQTRNRGTLGGSLCHADPAAELPTACAALDATLVVQSARGGGRRIAMAEFATDLMTVSLDEGELLAEIHIAPWGPAHGCAFMEFGRRHGDFAIASAAALIETDEAGRVTRASLTLGGVGPVPIRLAEAERWLVGARPDPALIDAVAAEVDVLDALDDPAYPARYRRRVAGRLLRAALQRALDAAVGSERKGRNP